MKHKIDINALREAFVSESHEGWHAIPDTTIGNVSANIIGGATSSQHGFKFHISISPVNLVEAAVIIAEEINQSDCPKIGIKFSNQLLANSPSKQPSKQVAFSPVGSGQDGQLTQSDLLLFSNLLLSIDKRLHKVKIGFDSLPFNADNRPAKYEHVIHYTDGTPSRFGYRHENSVILEDSLFTDITGSAESNVFPQGNSFLVRQSYFNELPATQKHNPAQAQDPFASLQLTNPNQIVAESYDEVDTIEEDKLLEPFKTSHPYLSFAIQHPALVSAGVGLLVAVAVVAIIMTCGVAAAIGTVTGLTATAATAATASTTGLLASTATFFSMPSSLSSYVASQNNDVEELDVQPVIA